MTIANVQFKSYTPTLLEIEPKCLVQFRPHSKYNGEFDFDWVRLGDSLNKGDVWYKNIMGYYETPKKANGDYNYCNSKFIQNTKAYDNKYIFKEFTTDNIMDYYGKTAIKARQLYKWQWEQLWEML